MKRANLLRTAVLLAASLSACHSARPPIGAAARPRWVVIAPHPDDEVLIASGVLVRAVADGHPVGVVVMTNGDADCVHDGLLRQRESVEGLAALGVPESAVHFLGYPDGGLAKLGRTPLAVRRRARDGSCESGDTTYGERGADRADYHRARTGAPATYTREEVVGDLARVLDELEPTDVAITHPEDTHPDHAATYMLFRDALDRLTRAPRVHRAMVHNGDCWPAGAEPHEPCPRTTIAPSLPTPPLSGRLTGYQARERLAVPPSLLVPDPAKNPKLRAIAAHRSQTRGTLESYLFGFARSDEAFFPETLARHGSSWLRVGATRGIARARFARGPARFAPPGAGGYAVDLDATRLEARLVRRAPGGDVLLHLWPLPHDLWSSDADAEESFELRIEPHPDDRVTELSFHCRGALTGVAVDLEPPQVDSAVSASPTARRAR